MIGNEVPTKSITEKVLDTSKKVGVIGIIVGVIGRSVILFQTGITLLVGSFIGEKLRKKK